MDPVVILGSETVSVGPGQEQRLAVRIRNPGRRVEAYRVDVVGAPAAFAQVVPATVSVLPGREAELDVTFRPPGGASTPTGTLPFAIRATSEVDQGSSAVAEGRLDLAGVAGLQAWAPETLRAGRWSARYHVEFANDGNAAVRLALMAHDPAATTRLHLAPDVVDLPPGGRATSVLKVRARQPFLRGSKINRNVQVSCQTFPFGTERPLPGGAPPQGDANHRTFQVMFEQRPVLPKLAIPLLVLAATALVAFAVVKLRSGKDLALALATPDLPAKSLKATAAGPTSIVLRWPEIADAEGYGIIQTSGPQAKVPAAPLPRSQTSLQFDALAPATKYCFQLTAVGPAERASAPEEMCATTDAPNTLPVPAIVSVAPLNGKYRVTWTWDAPPDVSDGVQFNVIIGGILPGISSTGSPADVVIPSQVDAYDEKVQVQAVHGDDKSPLSAESTVSIPAAVPETVPTVPPTEPATTTSTAASTATTAVATPGETSTTVSVVPATVAGGVLVGETTIGASVGSVVTSSTTNPTNPTATTATTASSTGPTVSGLTDATTVQDVDPTWVAVLGSPPPPTAGGVPLDEFKEEAAKNFDVPVDKIGVFTTRDTFVSDATGAMDPRFTSPKQLSSARFVYVAAPDEATADKVCALNRACSLVVHIEGAGRASSGKPILVIGSLQQGTSMPTLDQQLDRQRTALGRRDVYAVDGAAFPSLGQKGPVLILGGFATTADVTAFCTLVQRSPCDARTLPAG